MAGVLDQLEAIRAQAGEVRTTGLDNDTVCAFVSRDPELAEAVNAATEEFEALNREFPELMKLVTPTKVRVFGPVTEEIRGALADFQPEYMNEVAAFHRKP